MITNDVSVIQRAFQLAIGGGCHSVADIRRKLSAEGYESVGAHLHGASIQRQLREALTARSVQLTAHKDGDL
ncbi:hypothetical protein [Sphingomonas sp. S6]|jgi:hypothetical protein|uniref:hypothetical protein n=1 Tax=Sphingomonas sp. S6 TaxID=3368600 RepID=UPI000FC393DE|nr:hypothetical protein [uncultured Sphingomonas sp.]RTL23472.1 MAG: hypothetical protein EKK50_00430 [Sphingomonadaceae bacterium]